MPVRKIACVVWDRRNHDIEVICIGRDPEHFFGSEDVATALASATNSSVAIAEPDPRGAVREVLERTVAIVPAGGRPDR